MPVRRRVLALLGMVSFVACQTLHMRVPGDLVLAPSRPVAGRQGLLPGRSLRFGSVETRDLERSWVKGSERRGEEYSGRRIAEGSYQEDFSFRLLSALVAGIVSWGGAHSPAPSL